MKQNNIKGEYAQGLIRFLEEKVFYVHKKGSEKKIRSKWSGGVIEKISEHINQYFKQILVEKHE